MSKYRIDFLYTGSVEARPTLPTTGGEPETPTAAAPTQFPPPVVYVSHNFTPEPVEIRVTMPQTDGTMFPFKTLHGVISPQSAPENKDADALMASAFPKGAVDVSAAKPGDEITITVAGTSEGPCAFSVVAEIDDSSAAPAVSTAGVPATIPAPPTVQA